MKVTLIRATANPEELVATAARLCYSQKQVEDIMGSFKENEVERFVGMLADMGHGSPIEHVSFTFGIEDVSRSLSHQLVRHRLASYSQRSQRYTKSLEGEYVIPKDIEESPALKRIFEEHMLEVTQVYRLLTKELMDNYIRKDGLKNSKAEKKAIENARAVLPNATQTSLIVTMNARVLLHFFGERCCNRAQDEIREMAWEMLKVCKKEAPSIFKKGGPKCIKEGKCTEGKMTCGKPYERV